MVINYVEDIVDGIENDTVLIPVGQFSYYMCHHAIWETHTDERQLGESQQTAANYSTSGARC